MNPIHILLAEDNPADARLVKEALNDNRIFANLHHTIDGVETMDFLRRQGKFLDAPRPDLILLDLNMPRMDGREVLVAIKTDPNFAAIPVVVLTTSDSEADVVRAYTAHANCFLTKPINFTDFTDMIHRATDFWFTLVRLPGA